MKKKRNDLSILNIIACLIIILIVLGLAYSFYVYKKNIGEKGENFIVCKDEDNCIASMHIHADIKVKVCSKEIDFPLEKGELAGLHTHKERNLIHFHERLKYDNKTNSIIETDKLKLGAFFDIMNVKLTNECVADKCNGDSCNGRTGSMKMFVNGVENNEFNNYVWEDKDNIEIIFE